MTPQPWPAHPRWEWLRTRTPVDWPKYVEAFIALQALEHRGRLTAEARVAAMQAVDAAWLRLAAAVEGGQDDAACIALARAWLDTVTREYKAAAGRL